MNAQKSAKHRAVLDARTRYEAELIEWGERMRQQDNERMDKLTATHRELMSSMGSSLAMREDIFASNRVKQLQMQQEELRAKEERQAEQLAQAEERRRQANEQRSQGSLTMRTTWDLGRQQAQRMERIREAEREVIRERIEKQGTGPINAPAGAPEFRRRIIPSSPSLALTDGSLPEAQQSSNTARQSSNYSARQSCSTRHGSYSPRQRSAEPAAWPYALHDSPQPVRGRSLTLPPQSHPTPQEVSLAAAMPADPTEWCDEEEV